jgi:hypothetical protein
MSDELHVITLRPGGWSLAHPPSCDEDRCLTHRVVVDQLRSPPPHLLQGPHPCRVDEAGRLVIESRHAWLADDRAVPPPLLTERVNRLGHWPVDPREARPEGWGRGR